jgi:hypothetical protein
LQLSHGVQVKSQIIIGTGLDPFQDEENSGRKTDIVNTTETHGKLAD